MSEQLVLALTEALQDEYKARATYRAIIHKFGPVRPFANIVEAEERHIQALLPLFGRYGIPVPEDDWPTRVTAPDSVAQACKEGVQAEVENGAMYERLLAMTMNYPAVQRVFRNLQRASQKNHLPAFQRCAASETRGTRGVTCQEQSASAMAEEGTRPRDRNPSGDKTTDIETSPVVNQRHRQRKRHRRGRPN